jgi:hypothetical protein
VKAELRGDRGEAALSEDFFRSREFCDAEGVTHSLLLGDATLPVIVREIEAGGIDAISPYGYPGATLAGESAVDPASADWAATGLVSLFARDRAGPPSLEGGSERSRLQVHDPSLERSLRPRLGSQIRANERAGWEVGLTPAGDVSEADVAAFHALYTETMTRTEAAPRYFFEPGYLAKVLAFPGAWLLAARSGEGPPGAGAIAALSDGVLHYFLGGTADAALGDSPFKNVVAAMLDLADVLGTPLNLGGGLRPGDGLEDFKRGFANAELPFVTHEVVCDEAAYARLAGGREAGGFFPAYRA